MKTLIDKPPAEQKTLIARAQAAIEKYVYKHAVTHILYRVVRCGCVVAQTGVVWLCGRSYLEWCSCGCVVVQPGVVWDGFILVAVWQKLFRVV